MLPHSAKIINTETTGETERRPAPEGIGRVYLDIETMGVPLFISINELEIIAHGREHAFTNVVPRMF